MNWRAHAHADEDCLLMGMCIPVYEMYEYFWNSK